MPNIDIENLKKSKLFYKNLLNNQLSKKEINDLSKMDNDDFKIYLKKYQEKLNKYHLSDKFKELFIKSAKNNYEYYKLKKDKEKSKSFYDIKKIIDGFKIDESTLKSINSKILFIMVKYALLINNYPNLNQDELKLLMEYFLQKLNISQKEFLIFSYNLIEKEIDKKIKKLNEKIIKDKELIKKDKVVKKK
jgi:hypothetical protein